MTRTRTDDLLFRPWIVCQGNRERWLNAVRRFAPTQMPAPLVPLVMPGEPATAVTMLGGQTSAVILWCTDRDRLVATCDHLLHTSLEAPQVLQLVAEEGLSDRGRLLLAEFPAAAVVAKPEDLPRLRPLIHGYFARFRQHLDY